MRSSFLVFIILLFGGQILKAQEYLDDIIGNPVLQNHKPEATYKSDDAPLKLPFIDDFSYNSYWPSLALWTDQDVFINNSYGKVPYSVGVATFDAVDANGQHYTGTTERFAADKLTSKPIDLSSADKQSLVLSFYYQPQGEGNAPEKYDSLLLQIDTETGNWKTIWVAPGSTYEDFKRDSLHLDVDESEINGFKYVAIAITDTAYFKTNFRFRFMNYASLAGSSTPSAAINCDHWNIDFVYLDDHRNTSDSVFYDVAFTRPAYTCLKNFTSVPWKHYESAIAVENTRIQTQIRNNFNEEIKSNLHFVLYDVTNKPVAIDSNNNGNSNYEPLYNIPGNWDCEENPIIYNSQVDAATFLFKSVLEPDDADIIKGNDTAYTYQSFDNYYSYDDGTAENAYGIDAAYAMVAYKFKTYQSDTLQGFSMCFLPNKPADAAATHFIASVWKADNNGLPGERIVNMEVQRPELDTKNNLFVTINLDTNAVFIEEGELFFIGWEQTSALRMNVGWDENMKYLNKEHVYYNISGDWMKSSFDGSLMLRPIFGESLTTASSENYANLDQIAIYPNPAHESISICGLANNDHGTISIYNSIGCLQKSFTISQSNYDISMLPAGLYLVVVQTNAKSQSFKLIKNQ